MDLPVPDINDQLFAGVTLLLGWPPLEQFPRPRIHGLAAFFHQPAQSLVLLPRIGHQAHGFAQLLAFPGQAHLFLHAVVIGAHALGDLRQITAAVRGHDGGCIPGSAPLPSGEAAAGRALETAFAQQRVQALIERRDAVVVETRSDGAENRHGRAANGEGLAIALHLLAHVAQRVLGALAVELVDGHQVGEIQHVDFLQLAGGTEFRRHHVHGRIHQGHHGGVALTDPRSLHQHQIEAPSTDRRDGVSQVLGHLVAGYPGGQGAHVNVGVIDGIHADTVTEQRAAGFAP